MRRRSGITLFLSYGRWSRPRRCGSLCGSTATTTSDSDAWWDAFFSWREQAVLAFQLAKDMRNTRDSITGAQSGHSWFFFYGAFLHFPHHLDEHFHILICIKFKVWGLRFRAHSWVFLHLSFAVIRSVAEQFVGLQLWLHDGDLPCYCYCYS